MGTITSTLVPWPGEVTTLIVPPTSRSRSLMLINPKPPLLSEFVVSGDCFTAVCKDHVQADQRCVSGECIDFVGIG